jgi:TPR repeat protein
MPTDMRSLPYSFKLAAGQGLAEDQFNYGLCLHNGEGVSIDMRNAAHYFKLGADQGLARAHRVTRKSLRSDAWNEH